MMFIVSILTVPIMIKSGVEQSFAAGFSLSFFIDFFKRIGFKLFLIEIVFAFLAVFGYIIGYMAFIVGVYFVMGWMMFAKWHAYEKLYRRYIERGGTELEFSPELSSVPANRRPPPPPIQPQAEQQPQPPLPPGTPPGV